MIECGYYSESKHDTCNLPANHSSRHFDYGKDQQPMLFSSKKFEKTQIRVRKTRPARHVCMPGCKSKYHN
jgi:hypothetical protein